ncbi:MAG: CBS domain-containing protein [Gemmatimonadota bacterium]|nr:CBS domain-containing protein [Gemmatimonadota bacterium]
MQRQAHPPAIDMATPLRVADLMETDIETVQAEELVGEAISKLADAHVHGLAVLKEHTRQLVGVLSTTDLLDRLAEVNTPEERANVLSNTKVRDLMTPNPATTTLDEEIREVAQQMLYLEIHRVFVVEEEELVGVISQSDIVRAVGTGKL